MSVKANPALADKKRLRAILHTRVSTTEQELNTSHASQLAADLKKAGELNAEVVATFQETVSGALYLARPDIQASLTMIENGEADILIFPRLDRAGRDVDNLRAVRKRVRQAGGEMVFADGMHFENNSNGNFMFTVLGAAAENERAMISERMSGGLRALANQGVQVACTKCAYGLRVVQKDDVTRGEFPREMKGKYLILEERAAIVRQYIFEAKGVRAESLRQMQRNLRHAGILSPTGLKLWGTATISNIIQNPIYKGQASHGRTRSYIDESRVERGLRARVVCTRPPGEYITIEAPAIVSEELWEKANRNLHTARAKHSGPRHRRYMLSGLLTCPVCDAKMVARGRVCRSLDPKTPARVQYGCRFGVANNTRECVPRTYVSLFIERAVIAALIHLLDNPEALKTARDLYSKELSEARSKTASLPQSELKAIKAKLTRLSAREVVAAESKMEARLNGSGVEVWNEMLSSIQTERTALEARVGEVELSTNSKPVAPAAIEETLREAGKSAVQILRAALGDETPGNGAHRHDLISQIVERIYPIAKGKKTLGARIVLISEGDTEYSLLSQNQKITVVIEDKNTVSEKQTV